MSIKAKAPPRRSQNPRKNLGFTVIEMLVTIGVLILVAAGVSTIFTSIADTVDTGKKVAQINRFAAQLERVMRQDFENMTRDGFLVIAQQTAPGANPSGDVQLWPGDASGPNRKGRPRRIDEIMFFARGDFETSRRTIANGMIAKSSEAAIYYGHGQKRVPDLVNINNDMNLFFNPRVTDTNIDGDARLGFAPFGKLNPNQYARDWALLRHVTLLAQPQSAGQSLPDEVFGVARISQDRQWLEDSARQISLQPAARSIFNSLTQSGFGNNPLPPSGFDLPKWYRQYTGGGLVPFGYESPALRSSGLVDIVTEDLASIRATTYGVSFSDSPTDYWSRGNINQNPLVMDLSYDEFAEVFWEDPLNPPNASNATGLTLPINGSPTPHFTNVRKWMIDALPSLWDLNPTTPIQLSRVRYEDIPTRLIYDQDAFADNDSGDRDRIYAEADQEMLGSSVFIPQCTEFIVEWSYGFIDATITDPTNPRYKQMLWYGLDRWIDANNDGIIETTGNGVTPGQDQNVAQFYNRRTNVPAIPNFERGPSPEMIVGHMALTPGFGTPPDTEIATFGYPDLRGNDWLWPKFIRVTISIADPKDNSVEQTFQMVFDIPDATNN